AGLAPGFTVLDEARRRELGERVLAALVAPAALPGAEPARPAGLSAALEAVSAAKGGLVAPAEPHAAFHVAYEAALAAEGAVDFDDLVARAARLLADSPLALAEAQQRCRYLFVDEYQDVNAAQVRLVGLLAGAPGASLCAVGDPDQAIYGFRGADPAHFARFSADHPGATTVT